MQKSQESQNISLYGRITCAFRLLKRESTKDFTVNVWLRRFSQCRARNTIHTSIIPLLWSAWRASYDWSCAVRGDTNTIEKWNLSVMCKFKSAVTFDPGQSSLTKESLHHTLTYSYMVEEQQVVVSTAWNISVVRHVVFDSSLLTLSPPTASFSETASRRPFLQLTLTLPTLWLFRRKCDGLRSHTPCQEVCV